MAHVDTDYSSVEVSSYLTDSSSRGSSPSETSVDIASSPHQSLIADIFASSKFLDQTHHRRRPRRPIAMLPPTRTRTSQGRTFKDAPVISPSKHHMNLRKREPLIAIAGQPRGWKTVPTAYNCATGGEPSPHDPHRRPAPSPAPRPNPEHAQAKKTRKSRPRRGRRRRAASLSGNPDDLEDWELEDPMIQHLAGAVLAIREERKRTMKRLERIDSKIERVRRSLAERKRGGKS